MSSRRNPDPPPVAIVGFEVLDKIGDGGFSVVYRARQQSMNREVAVKVLNIGFATDAERRTFERECHALGQLSHHPNIVTVFNESVTGDGRPCIVMELYHQTYRERLDAVGPLNVEEVLSVGVRICGALQTAHDAAVLHRDLKPHNIFLSAYGEPALGDFGISTIDDERSQNAGTSGLSVAYAPPEMLEDGATGVTSDLYSLAATLYQLVAGETPFASPELRTTVRKILTEPPPAVNRPGVPQGFDRVMRKALAKNPGDRPESALELAEMFRELQARAGLDRTAIPRLSVTIDEPTDRSDGRAGAGSALPPPAPGGADAPIGADRAGTGTGAVVPASGRRDGGEGDDSAVDRGPAQDRAADGTLSGSTIARARERPETVEEIDDDTGERRRRLIAAGVGGGVILVFVLALSLFGGGGDEPETDTTRAPPPTDEFLAPLESPSAVRLVVVGERRVEVRFAKPDDAATVKATIVSQGARNGDVEARERSPITFVDDNPRRLCVELVALGEGGRVSQPTDAVCVGDS